MKKILIIRTAPMEQYINAYSALTSDDTDVAVLTQRATNSAVLDATPVRLFSYATARLYLWSLSIADIKALRAQKFEHIYILYTNKLGQGYWQARILAYVMGARKILSRDPSGNEETLTFGSEVRDFIRFKLAFVGYGIIWLGLWLKRKVWDARRH